LVVVAILRLVVAALMFFNGFGGDLRTAPAAPQTDDATRRF